MITALIPSSPIPSHPDMGIIEETIGSIRDRVACPIIVMCDGVRKEQSHLEPAYREYQRRLLWKCLHEWKDITAQVHRFHMHQAAMTRLALSQVSTPLVLFVEQDTPLIGDIPFDQLTHVLDGGMLNLIRFAHEAEILEPHKHLMLGPAVMDGVPVMLTRQWSQRPHLARTDFYRHLLDTYFSAAARCFIEDRLHSPNQTEPWSQWLTAIYNPEGNIKRSTHLDGRAGAPKYDADQVF